MIKNHQNMGHYSVYRNGAVDSLKKYIKTIFLFLMTIFCLALGVHAILSFPSALINWVRWIISLFDVDNDSIRDNILQNDILIGSTASMQPYDSNISELTKRASWREAAIDGAISTFSLALSGANGLYATACSGSLLSLIGIVIPQAILAGISSCIVAGLGMAAVNFLTYMVGSYNNQGGWVYDDDAETSKRGTLNGPLALDSNFRHLMGNIYTLRNVTNHATTYNLMSTHAPKYMERLKHSAPVYFINETLVDHIGHQMIIAMDSHNVSVMADLAGHEDAIKTLADCDPGSYCPSPTRRYANQTMLKRDDSGFWISYNDWGTNIGYDKDWLDWDEIEKMARDLAYEDPFGLIQQVQPCEERQCYSVSDKFCFAGGMSPDRGQQSAFVGEAYIQAYGGVDGECDNG